MNGAAVSETSYGQSDHVLAYAGKGEIVVAWLGDGSGGIGIYAQKLGYSKGEALEESTQKPVSLTLYGNVLRPSDNKRTIVEYNPGI